MQPFDYDAVDEQGKHYLFERRQEGNRIFLTLKKETIKNVRRLRALGSLSAANAGDAGYYVCPRNITMMGDFLTEFRPREDVIFDYKHPVLSLFGIKKPGLCALVRIERNYKYHIEIAVRGGVYTLSVLYDFTEHDPVYDDIRMEIVLLPEGGTYADMARAERETRLARGEITTLREKCARAAVDYARRYPLIRIRMGWKPSPSPVPHQTLQNEPEMFAACSFARVRDIADELLRQGVHGAELQLVGWNVSGHDGRFPQLFPAEPRLGGEEELKKTIAYVREKGFRISLHTNLIDSYEIADCFTWDDVCIRRDGSYDQTGHYSGGYAYHVCLKKQLKNCRRDLPAVAALCLDGVHFTDVISIVEPDDCHAPEHPCPTAESVRTAQQIMRETRERMGAFSSEGAMDFALGALDYALYVSFGDGFGKKDVPVCDVCLPFFELIYHGILLYNPISPTVNYPIKSPRERLMLYLRGGKPSLYFFSRFRTGGQKNWMGETDLVSTTDGDLAAAVAAVGTAAAEYADGGFDQRQFVFLRDYAVLGNGLEVAFYEDGSAVVGNFADVPLTYRKRTVAAGTYEVIACCEP